MRAQSIRHANIPKAERALDAIVSEMVRLDAQREREPIAARSLMGTPFDCARPVPTRQECIVAAILDEPIYGALRSAVRTIGEHLFEVCGGTEEMEAIMNRIADGRPHDGGRYASIMDHAWDGIGDWFA